MEHLINLPALALALGVAWTPVTVPTPQGVLAGPVASIPAVFDATGAARTWNEALADLATARVVAVGESHDHAAHHLIQAEVLTALAPRTSRLAVAFEMVGIEDQPVLASFMSGALSEADFAVWWKVHWGYNYALYKPIFDAAKAAGVPAYGLNAPIGLVKAVSQGGLSSLTPADRARLPRTIEQSADARYRAFVHESVAGHGPLTPEQLKNRLESMAVWNETMGEKVAQLTAEGSTVLVIVGLGHVYYKAGVLESAMRRGAGLVKALLPVSAAPRPDELAFADWFRVTD